MTFRMTGLSPLYKKNDKTEVGNYRPVSIPCNISKIFERVIYDQVEGHLNENKILYSFQSGFRCGSSRHAEGFRYG